MNDFTVYRALFIVALVLLGVVIPLVIMLGHSLVTRLKGWVVEKADEAQAKQDSETSASEDKPSFPGTRIRIDDAWLHRI